MSHKDDDIHANTWASVDDEAGVEDVDGTQNPDDSDGDDSDGLKMMATEVGMGKTTSRMVRIRIAGWLGRQSG